MTTTYCALMEELGAVDLDENDVLTVSSTISFFRNVDGVVTENGASVPISFSAGASLATINDAITDAVVAYADTAWSWPIPRTRVIFHTMQRGLVI